ncbi:MAG: sulfatase [Planctomycetes bacterium]|nr:sulfatase [Planctomycetota bacterium]
MSASMHPSRRNLLVAGGASLAARALGQGPTSAPRAKRVIWLQMAGGPPQLDMFDIKPTLNRLHGTLCPQEFVEGKRLAFIKGRPTLLGSPWRSYQVPSTGWTVSEHLPHFASIAEHTTLVRSMHTDQFNHAPADLMMFTGNAQPGAASMGAWASRELGSLNPNLPNYCVLISGGSDPTGGKSTWGAGFLPSQHQGVRLRSTGEPILYVQDPAGLSRPGRRAGLDALYRLNRMTWKQSADPNVRSRMEQYELAWRMQSSVPQVADLESEPAHVLKDYGVTPGRASFGSNCLLARRLVESGVRWVQLFDWGWDLHGTSTGDDLVDSFPKKCLAVDRPIAALVRDLHRRGLLEDTLVVWGGEFGRTPMNEARSGSTRLGRDHHGGCFSMWFAGAGVRKGEVLGATDELGYSIVHDPVSVRDLQATLLWSLGIDPYSTSVRHLGLNRRLIGPTDEGRIMHHWFG